jgi:hypothetical protein
MTIARDFNCRGWTAEQYDALIERMNLGGHSAPGVLYHWAATTPEGVRATDVYESREVADALAQNSIGPLAQQLGLPMPEVSEYEVHAILHP